MENLTSKETNSPSLEDTTQHAQSPSLQMEFLNTSGSPCHERSAATGLLHMNPTTPGNSQVEDSSSEFIESSSNSPFNLEMHIAKLQQMSKSPGEGFMFQSRPMITANSTVHTSHQVSDLCTSRPSAYPKTFFMIRLISRTCKKYSSLDAL